MRCIFRRTEDGGEIGWEDERDEPRWDTGVARALRGTAIVAAMMTGGIRGPLRMIPTVTCGYLMKTLRIQPTRIMSGRSMKKKRMTESDSEQNLLPQSL